jgi:hypothetical protein
MPHRDGLSNGRVTVEDVAMASSHARLTPFESRGQPFLKYGVEEQAWRGLITNKPRHG